MMKHYQVPAHEIRRELTVLNSRFIGSLSAVYCLDEAKAYIARIQAEFPDASHNVPAYLVGGAGSAIAHCSDAGEPGGTAGRPILAVLQGSGLGDVAVVVTRYFGGTKLGTGGLVRAYGDVARLLVEAVPRAKIISTYTVMLALPYRLLERTRLAVSSHSGQVIDETFTADVTLTARFPVENFRSFQVALQDLSAGSLQAEIIESGDVRVPL